jgi:ribosomal protein L7Ae-like RNA K-turn-binding protein
MENCNEIKTLVADNKHEKAFDLILKYAKENKTQQAENNIIILKSQYNESKQKYNLNLIDFAEWMRIQAKINVGIIQICESVSENVNYVIDNKLPKVFISYNHKDQPVALSIKEFLEQNGIKVIIDVEAMRAGEDIKHFIENCIKESGITLSIVSSNSLLSAWVAMETIWSNYDEVLHGRYFIPCNIDNDFFRASFTDSALDSLDEKTKEIDETIVNRLKKGRGIEDLTDERSRINRLKSELPTIIGKFKNSLCIDLSMSKFDQGMKKIVNDIKSI